MLRDDDRPGEINTIRGWIKESLLEKKEQEFDVNGEYGTLIEYFLDGELVATDGIIKGYRRKGA